MSGKPLRRKLIASVLLLSSLSPAASPLYAAASATMVKEETGELDLSATKALFDTQSAFFVDARSEYAYDISHIKGARSLTMSRFDEQFPEFSQNKSAETLIVVYCIGPRCSVPPSVSPAGLRHQHTMRALRWPSCRRWCSSCWWPGQCCRRNINPAITVRYHTSLDGSYADIQVHRQTIC